MLKYGSAGSRERTDAQVLDRLVQPGSRGSHGIKRGDQVIEARR
jgi:hypothetical protein